MAQPKILIVEDEALIAADLSEVIEQFGYSVVGSPATGEEAVELVRAANPDAVLMDIRLAGAMDGIEAARKIAEFSDVPIIYLTSHADTATLERAKVTDPAGYVLKPFRELELRAVIEMALPDEADDDDGDGEGAPAHEVSEDLLQQLKRIEPFTGISEQRLAKLCRRSRQADVDAGELIALEGDETVSGFIVLHGRVSMIKSNIDGKELIVELLPEGDAFGLMAAIDRSSYPVTARADVASQILWIPRVDFVNFLEANPDISKTFLERTFARLRDAHSLSLSLAHDRVEVRIASALTALLPKLCAHPEGQETDQVVKMTRQQLADLVGSTQETVIRITKQLERDEILNLSTPGEIRVVDPDRLEDLAAGSI